MSFQITINTFISGKKFKRNKDSSILAKTKSLNVWQNKSLLQKLVQFKTCLLYVCRYLKQQYKSNPVQLVFDYTLQQNKEISIPGIDLHRH